MVKRFLCCVTIIVTAFAAAAALNMLAGNIRAARPAVVPDYALSAATVVLVPLDSRPPCTQFVEQLARLAGIRVVLPPAELLDNYRRPADRAGLREWLRKEAAGADAAIVSVDMLVHGGLLASRLGTGAADDAAAALALLEGLHKDYPRLKLFAFSIIPRLLVADNAETARYQKKMLEYSVLKDAVLTFENPLDRDKVTKLSAEIPPAVVNRYLSLYEANSALNFRLVAMAEAGTLAGLVIGQDDGFPLGMPNMLRNRLAYYVSHRPALAERVFITRGTDEVALTVLGRAAALSAEYRPRVCVRYSHAEVPGMVMPYMPHSVARTVDEKVAIAGGTLVREPAEADFVLYVHIGNVRTGPGVLRGAAREVKGLMAAGHRVSVVDLSEHFFAEETLLPYLVKEGVDLTRLMAYAGWNTTSNSVGTAVTQATLFAAALERAGEAGPPPGLYKRQLEFLTSRLLDDWYYQKDVQPYVNARLKKYKLDPYNLGANLQRVDAWIGSLLAARADALYREALAGRTLPGEAGRRYVISGLTLKSHLPWQRTFEVQLEPSLDFAALEE